MKLGVSENEDWPVYRVHDPKDDHYFVLDVELTDADYRDYLRVSNEWEKWQKKLSRLVGRN